MTTAATITSSRKPKVFWKKDEERLIATYLQRHGVSYDDRKLIRKAREAQAAVLPANRQKLLHTITSIQNIVELLKQEPLPLPEPEVPIAVAEEPSVSTEAISEVAPEPITRVQEPETSPVVDPIAESLSALSKSLTTMFFDMLASDMAEQAKTRIPEIIRSTLPSTVSAVIPAKTEKARPPKVLIIGLNPSQRELMKSEFGAELDLRFWHDEDYGKLRDNAKQADHTISFLSHMGHKTTDCLKKLNVKPEHNPGGLTGLRTRLTRLYTEYVDNLPSKS